LPELGCSHDFAIDSVKDSFADLSYLRFGGVNQLAGWFVVDVRFMVFEGYEFFFVSCLVYSVVYTQFRCDVFVFCVDGLYGVRLCFFVGLGDVLFEKVVLACRSLAVISSFVSFLIFMALSLSLLRKGLLTCLNLVDCIIMSMSVSNTFNSSTRGGFLVDLKPYVSLVLQIVPGLRKK